MDVTVAETSDNRSVPGPLKRPRDAQEDWDGDSEDARNTRIRDRGARFSDSPDGSRSSDRRVHTLEAEIAHLRQTMDSFKASCKQDAQASIQSERRRFEEEADEFIEQQIQERGERALERISQLEVQVSQLKSEFSDAKELLHTRKDEFREVQKSLSTADAVSFTDVAKMSEIVHSEISQFAFLVSDSLEFTSVVSTSRFQELTSEESLVFNVVPPPLARRIVDHSKTNTLYLRWAIQAVLVHSAVRVVSQWCLPNGAVSSTLAKLYQGITETNKGTVFFVA